MVTLLDNLPDLSLIEIFSYLSFVDIVYSFNNLNTHFTALIVERGFSRHVNISSARYNHFQSILSLLRLNKIQSLTIDCYGSLFQLKSWPHLPDLRTLRIKGVRDFRDVFNFAEQHANTLTHLTVESSDYFSTFGATKRFPSDSPWNLCLFIHNTLNRLFALRSLDFGNEKTNHLHHWPLRTIETHLTYIRITIISPVVLFNLMITQPLSRTLQQLHITMGDVVSSPHPSFFDRNDWPRMEVLHTFTFIKSFSWHFSKEWFLLDRLTCFDVMPLLRRINFCIVIDINDIDRMHYSALFTDYRHVDVHYAFMINDNREHIQLINYVRDFNQSHRRELGSATFIAKCRSDNQSYNSHDLYYGENSRNRQHLFYTLPWTFNQFVELSVSDRCISNLQVFTLSSSANTNSCSRLVELNVSDNLPSFAAFLPQIVSSKQIVELHLFRCDRQISVNFPSVSRLILTDSLDSLSGCGLLTDLLSIQIIIHYQSPHFGNDDWTVLRTISTLPRLSSLRVLLYDVQIPLDDTTCQIIAETAPIVSDFSFCFRRLYDTNDYDVDIVYMEHSLFIQQLKNRILHLPLNKQAYIIVEEDGCGIGIWF